MASVKVTTTIDCQVATPNDAHNLGKEIEERLYTAINAMMPNLRHSRFIQAGAIRFSLEIQGRRVNIKRSGEGGAAAPNSKGELNLQLEGQKKK